MPEKQEIFPFPDLAKLFLAFFRKVYYTIKARCRCDEMVDVADSKSAAGDSVPVRVRSPAPKNPDPIWGRDFLHVGVGLEPI